MVAGRLGVGDELLLGRGEEGSGGRLKASILSDAFEAILGSVYLDAGWDAARALVLRELGDAIAKAGEEPDDFDHKSRLQEKAVRDGDGTPRYVVVGSGPDHDRAYRAEVYLGGKLWGTGSGRSKKDAEQEAARVAWEELGGTTVAVTAIPETAVLAESALPETALPEIGTAVPETAVPGVGDA
jgi:ribonuclease-3